MPKNQALPMMSGTVERNRKARDKAEMEIVNLRYGSIAWQALKNRLLWLNGEIASELKIGEIR